MELVARLGGQEHEIAVDVRRPDATLGDLVAAVDRRFGPLAGRVTRGPLIDGRRVPLDCPLDECGLYPASIVDFDPPTAAASNCRGGGGLQLVVVGGIDAGCHAPFTGELVVGRSPSCDVVLPSETVSRRHARLRTSGGQVSVDDLGSRNGTWLGTGVVTGVTAVAVGTRMRLGAVELAVRPPPADQVRALEPPVGAESGQPRPFNRPPRRAAPPPPGALAVPAPPAPPAPAAPVSLVAIVVPLVLAVVLAVALRTVTYAAFALLSPIVLVGNGIENRRRARRAARRERARYASDLDAFCERLEAAAQRERDRLDELAPDVASVLQRASGPSSRLWERRPTDPDFLVVRAGTGDVHWLPALEGDGQPRPESLESVVAAAVYADWPVAVDLDAGPVGIAGDRDAALAVARFLVVQAAVHHGPADVRVVIVAAADRADEWSWTAWLPHSRDAATGRRRVPFDTMPATGVSALVASGPRLLAVIDEDGTVGSRRSVGRALFRAGATGAVLAATVDRLPALCRTVVEVDADGTASVSSPGTGDRTITVLAAGLRRHAALDAARALARFDDGDVDATAARLPQRVRLLPLLALDPVEPAAILRRWHAAGPDPRPIAALGCTADDVFELDLVRDGPHGLVAGTTGAGKSELLRTLVASFAASNSADHLTLVLVDFKGGSAFDECARLPHVVGVVTDLDDHLAARALRCLEAELRRRERLLRAAGAGDLSDYRARAGCDDEPLPRLLVVIDEFATLKAELPTFVDALVGVAQRGRSLGLHLVLATQRPAGAVSDAIRANTNVRIALRVQDAGDSTDVVGCADAATIPRHQPGRAVVRLGHGDVVEVQTAYSASAADAGARHPVEVRGIDAPAADSDGPGAGGQTELAGLVDCIVAAHRASGRPWPRRPWPDPLPGRVDLADVLARETGAPDAVAFALADEPDQQRLHPWSWRPGAGHLLVLGAGGSGVTTALASIALSLATTRPADQCHLYVVDGGAGELAPLGRLPHAGAWIGPGDGERRVRLLRHLQAEVARRQQLAADERCARPTVTVLVDGLAGFGDTGDLAALAVLDDLTRVVTDGAEVGVRFVFGADRLASIPTAITALVGQRLVLRLADPFDYGAVGLSPRAVPVLPPGRGVVTPGGQLVHVATPQDGLDAAVDRIAATAGPVRAAPAIGALPQRVAVASLRHAARWEVGGPWSLPVGVAEYDLSPARLTLYDAEHVLVAGPARSGRTTALHVIAVVAAAACPAATIAVVASPRSSLRPPGAVALVDIADLNGLAEMATTAAPLLILVDDADRVDDDGSVLAAIAGSGRPGVHLVAAGRADGLRGRYDHWTRNVRRCRVGVLLQPDTDVDGDLLGVALPRRAAVDLTVGRGYLVNGPDVDLVQLATPGHHDTTSSSHRP